MPSTHLPPLKPATCTIIVVLILSISIALPAPAVLLFHDDFENNRD